MRVGDLPPPPPFKLGENLTMVEPRVLGKNFGGCHQSTSHTTQVCSTLKKEIKVIIMRSDELINCVSFHGLLAKNLNRIRLLTIIMIREKD